MESQPKPVASPPTQAPPMPSSSPSPPAQASAPPERLLDHVLRAAAVVLTFIAAVVMGAAKEDLTPADSFFGASVTGPKIKSVNSAAFVYFIIANVLVLVYSIASLALSFVNRAASKGLELALSLADVVMLAFLFTSNGAASAIILVAEQGQARFFWTKFICSNASGFCASVKAAIVLSMFAAVVHLLLVFLKLLVLQKKSQ
ncbi:unnamed protein product [Musa acuminata subsp. malaccensis]|uniref:CASP-like protein n=1 Tax=Musa acuminata subsp. malaccensis TaxID=214687 RepID=A0A804L7Y5_MUSAM|nr:PREDICTED: CASP-like protein 1E1 [Musa acuminata subsp. malaccensis]CAG1864613.1 unnamed protein product [Musa acuminata subsp. malaccensis]